MKIANVLAAVEQARKALSRAVKIPNGFSKHPSAHYLGATFPGPDSETWTVTTAPMISDSFQVIDAAVNYKLENDANHAVVLLQPRQKGSGPGPTEDYLRRYQQVAWSAFRVAWILEAGAQQGTFLADAEAPRLPRGEFDGLAGEIDEALKRAKVTKAPKNSKEAEAIVTGILSPVLARHEYEERRRSYGGFWRRPQTDGLWARAGREPRTFALEVKLHEDRNNPITQAIEVLGAADAMVYVRMVPRNAKDETLKRAQTAKDALQEHAPMRYLTLRYP
jgi:hypothetical protein